MYNLGVASIVESSTLFLLTLLMILLASGSVLSWYALIPSTPPSLPNPLSLYPPNPQAASNKLVELIHITPAFILGAISRARLIFSDHILAAKP